LQAGANKEAATTSGLTPLHAACIDGRATVATLLLEAG
jgi:ankyrin repeat protein